MGSSPSRWAWAVLQSCDIVLGASAQGPILEEERKRREKARKRRELREWLISEARIDECFVDGKHLPLFEAIGVHCKDELARLAKSPRFDELTGIAEFSKRRILRAFKMPVLYSLR